MGMEQVSGYVGEALRYMETLSQGWKMIFQGMEMLPRYVEKTRLQREAAFLEVEKAFD